MNDLKNRAIDAWKARFVRKTETTSWGLSVLLHVSIALLLFSFVTCSVPIDDDEKQRNDTTMVEVEWGGSGGMKGVDAPLDLKPKGDPSGGNRDADITKKNKSVADRTESDRDRSPDKGNDAQLPEDPDGTEKNGAQEQGPPEQSQGSNSGPNNSDAAHGESDGEGNKPAGGSGGVSIGSGSIGRCWKVSPNAAAAGAEPVVGTATVTVAITVMYDGSVRVGGASGGNGAMKAQARSWAGRTRACVAEVGSPPVTTTIVYNFRAN